MAIYLESASHDQVREVMTWGYVAGVATNPKLLAAAGDTSLAALEPLCKLTAGRVFFQLTTRNFHAMLLQAQAAFSVSPSQVVLVIPCTLSGLQAVARLSLEIPCALAAVFSPGQAYLAREAGARYVIPYVNECTRLLGDGVGLVASIVRALNSSGRDSTEVLAAGIESSAEAVATVSAGAHHLALPIEVMREMARHPATEQLVERFDLLGGGP